VILAIFILNVIVGIFLIVECRCYEPLFEEQTFLERLGSLATLIFLALAGPTILVATHVVRGIRRLL